MGAVLCERGDDVSQGGEGLVDAGSLAQSVRGGARFGLPLASRQVHEVQLAHAENIQISVIGTELVIYLVGLLLTFYPPNQCLS